MKPMEVEILVAEVGGGPGDDRLYHILYDGTVVDESRMVVLGGDADAIADRLEAAYPEPGSIEVALRASAGALAGPDRTLAPDDLEVAVLARGNGRRAFRRIEGEALAGLLTSS
jgi:proteasome alpha subunit